MKLCYLAALCVFVSLTAAAQSTVCDLCWTIGGTQCCNTSSIECPGQCITISEDCYIEGRHYKAFQKACGNDDLCSMNCFSVTGPEVFKIRVGIQCDTGNYSNAYVSYTDCPEFAENGYQCPMCYINDTLESCTPTGFVNCTGPEMECLDYVAVVQYFDTIPRNVSIQGCVVTGGCNIGLSALPGAKQLVLEKMECTAAMKIPGLSTMCDLCWTIGGTQCCNTSSIECPGQCITISEDCYVEGRRYQAFQKACGNDDLCSMNCFSITGPEHFIVRVGIQCDTGNYSNQYVSYTDCPVYEENGYQCPVCYRNDTLESCTPTGFVNCTGPEMECLDYVAVVQYFDTVLRNVSIQGCVVTGGCNIGLSALPGAKQLQLEKMKCTAAMKIPDINSPDL